MYQTKAGSCYSQWFCKGFTQNCHPELVSGSHPCFLRPWREKSLSPKVFVGDGAGRMRGYKHCHAELVSASHPLLTTQATGMRLTGRFLLPSREKSLSPKVFVGDGAGRMRGYKNKVILSRLFTSPLAGEDARRAGEGYKNKVILDSIQDLIRLPLSLASAGFTLIELLVAIMIIGILAAVAVPQYQKAVMKSRFTAMMPIAKTLANANEVYYAEHDEYSTDPAKLNVTPQAGTPDGTAINMYSNPEEVSFVRVENPGVPNARYVVYQKLSENFPETTWCEAGDTRTEELCVALGGTLPDGLTGNSSGDNTNYKAYLLTGQARSGDSFAETGTEPEPETPTCPDNSVCDEDGNVTGCSTGYKLSGDACVEIPPCQGVSCDDNGNITECASGQTLNNGTCENCATAFPGATSCSTTSYAATACGEGYNLIGNTCKVALDSATQAKVNAVLASSTCTGSYAGSCHDNGDGTISRCDPGRSTYDAEHNKCLPSYQPDSGSFTYEHLYNADGKQVEHSGCFTTSTSGSECYRRLTTTYDPTTGNKVSWKDRTCQTNVVMDENFNCANGGTYSEGYDNSYSPTTGKKIAEYICPGNSDCSTYSSMTEWNDTRTQRRTCKDGKIEEHTCTEWNAWVNL